MNEKKYNALDSTLQKITSDVIKLSDKDKKDYNDHLGKVLECIVNQMKKNEVFKILYKNNVYTGSFYENLRISKPDEFDINLIFVLPAALKVIYNQKQPGFVKIKIVSLDDAQVKKHNVPSLEKHLKSWIDPKTGFLLRTYFMNWMQSVFTQALDGISLQDTTIKRSASGPAFTVKVSQPQLGLSEYSVDLVPVFEFPEKDLPSTPVRKLPKGALHKEWTVVPKAPPNVSDSTYWRMSFYKQEKEIMNNLNGMKHIIKLLKLFRDKENWKVLSSYAIKTVFLWECERQGGNEGFWQNGIGQLFVHMLRRLSEHLTKQSIQFYWDKNLNLLSQVKNDTLKIMSNRIIVVLKKIDSHLEDNPQLIENILGCTQTDIQEDNGHNSNTDCDLLIELDDRQSESIKTSTRASSPISPIQHSFSFETLENGISPINVTSNLDKCGLSKNKSEDKIGVAVQLRIGCKSNEIYQTNTNSDSIVDILSVILKEQQNIKQSLQSLTQEHTEIKKEIRELREENAQLRKHLHMNASTSQASTSVQRFLDLQPSKQNYHLSRSPLLIPEQKNSTAMNAIGKNTLISDPMTGNSYMKDLLDVFTV